MFDLSDEQVELVRSGTSKTKEWMLETGFPQLIGDLENVVAIWESGDLEQSARMLSTRLDSSISKLMSKLGKDFMPFALTIDEKNANAFREYISDNQEDWFEYAESDRKKWEKRREVFDDWFDDLERWQASALKKHFVLYPNEKQIRQENSGVWVDKFLSSAINGDEEALMMWMSDFSIWWTDEYRALNEFNRQQVEEALVWLLPQLDEDQKNHVQRKVEGWIADLGDL